MAFTPAGMFYLSNEDLAPSMNMMGGGIRGMLGVQNEDEAILELAKDYDVSDLDQREKFFRAVNKINPQKATDLRKESVEYDEQVAGKDLKEAKILKSKMATDFAYKTIGTSLERIFLHTGARTLFPYVMGGDYDPDKVGIDKDITMFEDQLKSVGEGFSNWLKSNPMTKEDAFEIINDSVKLKSAFQKYANSVGTDMERELSKLFRPSVQSSSQDNILNVTESESIDGPVPYQSTTSSNKEEEDVFNSLMGWTGKYPQNMQQY